MDNATDIRQSSVDLSLSTKLSTMVVDTLVDAVSRAPAFFSGALGAYVIHKSCA